ncbi:SWIM zinc finger family protein [Xenophilus arseniciresistens]|uniref:SWIM zinc finger family protein n=1 Tax=Xenophilus arseniciresistens TaxID=1283306 RepID=A0AAE3T1I2_9BURK|nr:SWIM zinc finger family protein [Xenophilus arseniciresistens]MDA7418011.1 SWIM zinc finger family protein [Xenophilus arseniciresistens]
MEFRYQYFGSTTVDESATAQAFRFAPDTLRPPTHFDATLRRDGLAHLQFREALSALHAVVVSDMRVRGRDKSAYRQWLEANEQSLLAQFMARAGELKTRAAALRTELTALREQKATLLKPFYQAQRKYFDWLYQANRDAWYVLDPVITVHPDRLLFEAFSQDESSYCAVSVSHNVFSHTGQMACGTTNIDYSASLYEEFQKIRDYRDTRLTVDPAGFGVQVGSDADLHEEKIDLPDSWVRGFLQVSSAMALPATVLELHPMDLHSLCATLRQHRERGGPRSIRVELAPEAAPRLVFEPWNIELPTRRSQLLGQPLQAPQTIRLWGRRRLLLLERLIALATRVRVHLLGTGLPSFWVVEMGEVTVTLGLSGWSANDWSAAARFHLLAPRHAVQDSCKLAVAQDLQQHWQATPAQIASRTGLPMADVNAALALWTQAGRAVYDLPAGRFAWRELMREPIELNTLQAASEEENAGLKLVLAGGVSLQGIDRAEDGSGRMRIRGEVKQGSRTEQPVLELNADEQITDTLCSCNHFQQHRLRRGPCSHMLALRLVAQPKIDAQRQGAAVEEARK